MVDENALLTGAVIFSPLADGSAEITIGPASCQPGFRIDNIVISELPSFNIPCTPDSGLPCSIDDTACHPQNATARVPMFDADSPPLGMVLLETFDNGIPEDWILRGARYVDGTALDPTAPRIVPDEFNTVCGAPSGGGSLSLEPTTSVTIPLTGLDPTKEYIVHLWWGSSEEMIGQAEMLFIDTPGGTSTPGFEAGPILLVDDDDNDPDLVDTFKTALFLAGFPEVEVRDTQNSDSEPDGETLSCYGTVIWFSGDASTTNGSAPAAGPGPAGEAALAQFLDTGGCLLIASQEYKNDHGTTQFMRDHLGVSLIHNNFGPTRVEGRGPFQGIPATNLNFGELQNLGDVITPDASAEIAFDSAQGPAAIAKIGGAGRATYWGFSFAALPSSARNDAMAQFLTWCGGDLNLTVTLEGTGAGNVSSSVPGINCGEDCFEEYPAGTQITLTATVDIDSTFTGWSGGGCTGTDDCVVTLTADTDVVATFDLIPPGVALTLIKNGTGTVTSTPAGINCGTTCTALFPQATQVSLNAIPDSGSTFVGWSGGGCSGTGTCVLTLASATDVTATFRTIDDPCTGALCLNSDRFRVDLQWRTSENLTGTAVAVPGVRSDDSGVLYFFDQSNWEMLIKVLDGCAINHHFWVFAAVTTDVAYQLTVTDTVTGMAAVYENPLGNAADAITATSALPVCDANASPRALPTFAVGAEASIVRQSSTDITPKQGNCIETPTRRCLTGDRFQVEVEWRTADTSGLGQVVPFGSEDSGLYTFFEPDNWEMLVKVLDGCTINGHFWVLAAATTDVGYTLTITDTDTGLVDTWNNPVGRASPAVIEIEAFATCP